MRGKWLLISGAVILAAVALGALSLLRRDAPRTETAVASVRPEPPATEISLPGTIRAQHVISVGVSVTGVIESFSVDVGQDVAEGQILARVASGGLETTREAAARAMEIAQTKVEQLDGRAIQARLEASRSRAEANRSRDEYERAKKAYQRQQVLQSAGATPRLVYERAQHDLETAQTEFEALDEVARQAGDRVTTLAQELQAARKSVDEKRQETDEATSSLAAAEVRSPATGIVVGRRGEAGQEIGPEEARELLQVAVDPSLLQVVVDPEPPVLARIHPGQPALVIIADVPGGLTGTVKEIKGNQAIVEFISPNPAVKPGMTAQAKIKLE
jgi:multidrug resistance efflux pump